MRPCEFLSHKALAAALAACCVGTAACDVADEALSPPRRDVASDTADAAPNRAPTAALDAGAGDAAYDGPYPSTNDGGATSKTYVLTDDTVLDPAAHLMWQRGDPGQYFEGVPTDYCAGLALAGNHDWRVPSIAELRTLLVEQPLCPLLDHAAFPTAFCDWYLSSDVVAGNVYDAEMLDFATGVTKSRGAIGGYYAYSARCVRPSP